MEKKEQLYEGKAKKVFAICLMKSFGVKRQLSLMRWDILWWTI